jgi:hypothetical protein
MALLEAMSIYLSQWKITSEATYVPRTSRNSYFLVIFSSNFFFPNSGILEQEKSEKHLEQCIEVTRKNS